MSGVKDATRLKLENDSKHSPLFLTTENINLQLPRTMCALDIISTPYVVPRVCGSSRSTRQGLTSKHCFKLCSAACQLSNC